MSVICISQVAAFSRTHCVLSNPEFEGTEIVFVIFRWSLFQVVASVTYTLSGFEVVTMTNMAHRGSCS